MECDVLHGRLDGSVSRLQSPSLGCLGLFRSQIGFRDLSCGYQRRSGTQDVKQAKSEEGSKQTTKDSHGSDTRG